MPYKEAIFWDSTNKSAIIQLSYLYIRVCLFIFIGILLTNDHLKTNKAKLSKFVHDARHLLVPCTTRANIALISLFASNAAHGNIWNKNLLLLFFCDNAQSNLPQPSCGNQPVNRLIKMKKKTYFMESMMRANSYAMRKRPITGDNMCDVRLSVYECVRSVFDTKRARSCRISQPHCRIQQPSAWLFHFG